MGTYVFFNSDPFYLSHHGILKQEWGVRRGPPYPLARTGNGRLDTKAQEKAKRRSSQTYGDIRSALDARRQVKKQKRIEKKDLKWVHKNEKRLKKDALKKSRKELDAYEKELSRYMDPYLKSGKISKQFAIKYNQRMAELMNQNIGDVPAPSGRVVRFIAKRGELGVHTALADARSDLSGYNRGVYSSGRVAFKQDKVNMATYEDEKWRRR